MPGPTAPPPPQAGIVHPNVVLLVDRTSVAFTATTMGGKPHVYVRAQHHTQWSSLTSDLQVRANHLAAKGLRKVARGHAPVPRHIARDAPTLLLKHFGDGGPTAGGPPLCPVGIAVLCLHPWPTGP